MRENTRLTEIVDIACGELSSPTGSPLSEAEIARIDLLRKVANLLGSPAFNAPESLVERAINIFERPMKRPLLARLLQTDFAAASARSGGSDSAHLLFDLDGTSARLLVQRVQGGYEVLGQVKGTDWFAECGSSWAKCGPDGKFKLAIDSSSNSITLSQSDKIFTLNIVIEA